MKELLKAKELREPEELKLLENGTLKKVKWLFELFHTDYYLRHLVRGWRQN